MAHPPHRLCREGGVTRLELLISLVIVVLVVVIGAPSVLGSASDRKDVSAGASISVAAMSAAAFYADHATYDGLSADAIRSMYAPTLEEDVVIASVNGGRNFCIAKPGSGSSTWYFYGPLGVLTQVKPDLC